MVTSSPLQVRSEGATVAQLKAVRLGVARVHVISEAGCVAYVLAQLDAGQGGWLLTLNLLHLRLCTHDPAYAALCASATLAVADGMPLVWASRLQGTPLPERVTGSNLISSLTVGAARCGKSIFLLGGAPGTAERAAAVLQARHPGLRIAGVLCPPLGFEEDTDKMVALRTAIAAAAPDIIYVALSTPKEDQVVSRLRAQLPQAWFVGVGISFSFLCGAVRRAPLWMQRSGLEWLHRLVQEPRRLAPRYASAVPFGTRLLVNAVLHRWRTRAAGGPPDSSSRPSTP